MDRIFHQKWWDYSGQRFQFEGHICLKYSVIWGLSALLAIFVLNPIFLTLVGLIPRTAGEIVLLVVYRASFGSIFILAKRFFMACPSSTAP